MEESPTELGPAPPARRRSRRTLWLIIAPIIVLVIASNVGDALAPSLVDRHPLWLIALNARNRNLVLVTNQLDPCPVLPGRHVPAPAVGPALLRARLPLRRRRGDAGWSARRPPTAASCGSAERFFATAAYPLVFIAPNNYICLFAGAAGMPIIAFVILNVTGTVVRLYLIRVVGDIFDSPIQTILDFIKDYRVPLLII